MIHFCTKSDPPPVLILLPTMEVFGQKPSDKQKGRQTGKAKTGINPRAGFRTLIFCLSMHIYFYTRVRCSLLVCQVSPRFAKIKQNLK